MKADIQSTKNATIAITSFKSFLVDCLSIMILLSFIFSILDESAQNYTDPDTSSLFYHREKKAVK